MGHVSTVGHLQFSSNVHSLPWSKPIHPLLGKSLHCERPPVGEEENVIFNFGCVFLSLTFSVLVLTALVGREARSVCVLPCVCEEQGRCEKLPGKITKSACYFLPPHIFLSSRSSVCVSVSLISMADLLLLMLAEYSWMWGNDENLLSPKSKKKVKHIWGLTAIWGPSDVFLSLSIERKSVLVYTCYRPVCQHS